MARSSSEKPFHLSNHKTTGPCVSQCLYLVENKEKGWTGVEVDLQRQGCDKSNSWAFCPGTKGEISYTNVSINRIHTALQ